LGFGKPKAKSLKPKCERRPITIGLLRDNREPGERRPDDREVLGREAAQDDIPAVGRQAAQLRGVAHQHRAGQVREHDAGALDPEGIDEAAVARALYTDGMPDPDLLIRTSGEMRISNFLLWQIAYTELWVTPTLWPDFGARDLYVAVADFQCRDRRFGRV